jgi:signal transduction histidine kinase
MNAEPTKILLVEDNPGDARLLREALRDVRDAQIELAHVGRLDEALGRLKEEQFKVILLDLSLPDSEGIETVVRVQGKAPAVPIVVLTGLDDDKTAVEAVRTGAQDYLVKGQIDGRLLVRAMRYAVERKRAQEEIQQYLRRIAALQDINLATTSTLDLHGVIDILLEKIDLVLPYSASTVRLWNQESGLLEPMACRNLDEKEWRAERWKGGHGIPSVVFENKAPRTVRNVQTDPQVPDPEFFRKHGLISYLGVPLIVKDEILGVLSFYTKEQHEFSDEEVEFLSTLAGQAAIAIHNSQLYEETRNQAVELEKANKGKDEFLSVVSHELRTPLNVIAGYAEMVRQGMLGEINPEQDRALGKVIDHSKGLLGMIAGILQVTSIEAEAVKVDTKQVVVGHLLDELKSLYDFSLGKDLSLHWDFPSESLSMTTDGEKLKHILQNLINNAIKFTDNGRVTVSARQVPGGKNVEFRVADSGIGIPEEMLPIIFEKFRQADSSESRAYGGVGLGLYIVKRFTEMLGGSVAVESQPGKGSTFSVTIPCEGPQAAKSVSPDGPAHSRRIADISSNVL